MKNIKFIIALILISFLGTSCSSKKKMTREESLKAREEWLKFSQREYKDISKEKIINAAEEVLRLTDGDDFNFAHRNDGFIAKRNWFIYAVLAAAQGVDTWNFTVKANKDGNQVASFYVTAANSVISGSVTGAGDATLMTTPSQDDIVQGNAIYQLFWGRIDYVLGLSKEWPDCETGKEKIKAGEQTGDLEKICDSVTFNDEPPKDLSDEEIERIFNKNYRAKWDYIKKTRPELYLEQKKKDPYL